MRKPPARTRRPARRGGRRTLTAPPGPAGRAAAAEILAWYDRERRDLPWRPPPGVSADPYRVWLSEVMLQQTTVAAAGPYFGDFVGRWPTVHDLAAADLDDVLRRWAGLGYYARARNLHRCARIVAWDLGGVFPDTEGELLRLPGIGPYTAAAVAAIAFGAKATPVDANVERVVARLFGVEAPLPAARPELRRLAATLTPDLRPGDHAQAMMDLGATVCTPRSPRCGVCPVAGRCRAHGLGTASELPRKTARPDRPLRHGVAFWVTAPDGSVLLRRRPESGLLGGMAEVPSTPWREAPWTDPHGEAPVAGDWRPVPGRVRHVFTHFRLELKVLRGHAATADGADGFWCPPERLDDQALPTVMRKVVQLVRRDEAPGRTGRGRRPKAAP